MFLIPRALALAVLVAAAGCPYLKHDGRGSSAFLDGTAHFRNRDYGAADQAFSAVAEHDPSYVDALVYRARIASIHDDVPRALSIMKQAESINAAKFNKDQNLWFHEVYARFLTQARIATPEDPDHLVGDGRTVVTLDWHGQLTAWERASQRAVWSQALRTDRGDRRNDDLAFGHGAVFAVARTAAGVALVAFALDTGAERWRTPLGKSAPDVSLTVDGDAVFVTGSTPEAGHVASDVRAVDAATGRIRWTHVVDDRPGALAAGSGRVVFRTRSGALIALHAGDGEPAWSLDLPPKFEGDRPVMAGDLVLLSTGDGALYALDATDKIYPRPLDRVRWQLPADRDRGATSFPAVAGDLVVVASRTGIDGFELTTGASRWHRAIRLFGGLRVPSSYGCVARGDVIVARLEQAVVAVDHAGTVRWIFQDQFASRGADLDPRAERGWTIAPAPPLLSDDGVWVAVRNSDVTHSLHLLKLAPEVAY